MPQEFDPDTAMGLFANIPAIESQRALEIARGLSIAFGDGRSQAMAVYQSTGSAKLAQSVEIEAFRRKAQNRG